MRLPWFPAAATCLVAVAAPARSESPPPALTDRLRAESYPVRVQAQADLQAWAAQRPEGAKRWMLEQLSGAGKADDPELRNRVRTALKQLVLEDLSRDRPGFVGIRMFSIPWDDEAKTGHAVRIDLVTDGSPGQQAGLEIGDVILALNGKGWKKPGADEAFARAISRTKPGETVRLDLARGDERLTVTVKLAARPWLSGNRYNKPGPWPWRKGRFPRTEEEARDAVFEHWCEKHGVLGRAAPES